jgi:hypothetical protein
MKKILAVMAAAMVVAACTSVPAAARSYHYHHHHGWMHVFRGSNAELRGNNATSASGSNSLANPNNAGGPGSGSAGWKTR